jgi:hypothetical protein
LFVLPIHPALARTTNRVMKKISPNTMAALGLAVACGFTAPQAGASIINFGFETGDLTGWDVEPGSGWARAARPGAATYWQMAPALYQYGGYAGTAFALLTPGTDGVYTTIAQTFELARGQALSGMAGYCMQPWYPPDAEAYVQMDGPNGFSALLWQAIPSWGGLTWEQYDEVDTFWWGTGWTGWQFEAPVSGLYTLSFGCRGTGDWYSTGVFDVASLTIGPVPDRATGFGSFVIALLAVSILHRRLF